jgi:hypothetical protein
MSDSSDNQYFLLPPAAKPKAAPAMPAVSAPPPSLAVERARENAVAYFVAVVVGLVFVAWSPQFWWVPAVVMVAYLFGLPRARAGGLTFEFADTFYYLGFALTIGSLIAALRLSDPHNHPRPEDIFGYFALAMITTIIGVVGRTTIQSFYRMPSETLEAVNEQIADRAREYLENLIQLNAQVERALSETTKRFDDHTLPWLKQIEGTLEATRTILTSMSERTDELHAQVERTTSMLRTQGEQLTTVARTMTESAEKTSGALATASLGLSEDLELVRKGLEGLANQVRDMTLDTTPLNHAIDTIGATASQVAQQVSQQVTQLDAASSRFREAADAITKTAAAVSDPSIKQSLDALGDELAKLANDTRAQRDSAKSDVDQMQAHLATVLKNAADMSRALDEIHDATIRKLERIG